MRVAITGASGMIGRALVRSLEADGHTVHRLVRDRGRAVAGDIWWQPSQGDLDAKALEGVGAVVHLAGHPIGRFLWTGSERTKLWDSRVNSGRLLANAIASLDAKPSVYVSQSGSNAYGPRGDEVLTESSTRGTGFLAELCAAWEQSAGPAVQAGVRVVHPRTGLVLDGHEGVLRKLRLPFLVFAGGRYGDGRQWMPWISLTDEVRAIRHLIDSDLAGPVNLCAPEPARNADFMAALGAALHRPARVPTPAWFFAGVLGEFGRTLALDSVRAVPQALLDSGFEFRDTDVAATLASLLA